MTRGRKKIGIVTYFGVSNYGSALQAYALQNVISELGYDAFVIDHVNTSLPHNVTMKQRVFRSRIVSGMKTPLKMIELLRAKEKRPSCSDKKKASFLEFEKVSLHVSGEDYLQTNSFDAFVCGSDQVWNLDMPGMSDLFFLRFAPQGKRIAYAPSFGMASVPWYNRRKLKKYLDEIPWVSVREASGVAIVEKVTGREVPQVLDPVLLARPDFWGDVDSLRDDILVCYFLSECSAHFREIRRLAYERGLRIIWIEAGSPPIMGGEVRTPSPVEFVNLLKSASYICTDSFHGLAFSLIFKTPYSIFDRAYESNAQQATRIDSLLSLVGADTTRSGACRSSDDLSFEEASELLSVERSKSLSYLATSLIEATGGDCDGGRIS